MVKRTAFKVKCHKFESQELQVNTLIIKGLKYLPYRSRIGMKGVIMILGINPSSIKHYDKIRFVLEILIL